MTEPVNPRGLAFGLSAYTIWGVFPLLMAALKPAGAIEIVAHRALWSLVVCLIIVAVARRWRQLLVIARSARTMAWLALAAALISLNWGVMVYAVVTDRVASSALGYYLNPLVTVLLAMAFFGERLRRLQVAAIGLATVAATLIAIDVGGVPWISLTLAVSFALYSFIKKKVGGQVDALSGLTLETAIIMPVAFGALWLIARTGDQTFLVHGQPGLGWTHDILMALTGTWTAGALILFAAGARRLPLNVLGLMQYLTPTAHFALAVWFFQEPMSSHRWAGFALVWLALVLVSVDSFRAGAARGRARRRAAAEAAEAEPRPAELG